MTTYAQIFCTLAEIEQALQTKGAEHEGFYLPKIKSVSQQMLMDFGLILPVTLTRKFNGLGRTVLFVPTLLSVSSIINDDDMLSTTDYILQPNNGHWANGPYSWIEVDPDAVNLSTWMCEEEGVQITGQWGLYLLTKALGATLGAALTDTTGTVIQVSDGSLVAPGMVVNVDSEDLYIESTNSTPVTSVTTITEPITDVNTQQITLANSTLVNVGEVLRIDLEKMRIIDKNDTSKIAFVERGWDKTIAAAHLDNATVDVYRKFNVERGVNGTTAATHLINAAISRRMVPDDIKELCVKMVCRSIRDGQGGYSGMMGDPTTGESRYIYVKPFEYDDILRKYRIPRAR